jgi:bifunctional enzyme Fae/Hps
MLDTKRSYLQIAFNRSFFEVREMVGFLPSSNRILIEAGTPFIKRYGERGIVSLKRWWSQKIQGPGYIVADLKCMDRGTTEVESAARAGASAATCLGLAPVETIDAFIETCDSVGIDSMVDMLNVRFPFEVLKDLRKLPQIIVLHRGVDEAQNRNKEVPWHQIQRIKASYEIIISVAGGENFQDVGKTIFNDADIAVVWRLFYENPQKTAQLAREFLKEIRQS